MDAYLRRLKRKSQVRGGTDTARYWLELVRLGLIPTQYIQILSMMRHPIARQILIHNRPTGTSYLLATFKLLQQPEIIVQDQYLLYLHFLQTVHSQWRNYWPRYEENYGARTQAIIDYFKTLGPNNPPVRADLISVVKELEIDLPERMRSRLPEVDWGVDSDSYPELNLIHLALRFIFPDANKALLLNQLQDFIGEIAVSNLKVESFFSRGPHFGLAANLGVATDYLETDRALTSSWDDFFKRTIQKQYSLISSIPEFVRISGWPSPEVIRRQLVNSLIQNFILGQIDSAFS